MKNEENEIVGDFNDPEVFFERHLNIAQQQTIVLHGMGDVCRFAIPALMFLIQLRQWQSVRVVILDIIEYSTAIHRLNDWDLELPGPITIRNLGDSGGETTIHSDNSTPEFRKDIEFLTILPGHLDYSLLNDHALLGDQVSVVVQLPDRFHASAAIDWSAVAGRVAIEKPLAASIPDAWALFRASSSDRLFGYSHWVSKTHIMNFLNSFVGSTDGSAADVD